MNIMKAVPLVLTLTLLTARQELTGCSNLLFLLPQSAQQRAQE